MANLQNQYFGQPQTAKKRRGLFLFTIVVLGIITCAVLSFWSFGQPALAAYQAELRSKGERLSTAEFSADFSPATNNTLANLTNLVARLGRPPADEMNFHLAQFVDAKQPRATWSLNRPPWPDANGISSGSWADLSRRMDAAAPSLHRLRQMLEHTAPNGGPRTNWSDYHIAWRERRIAATWLACAGLANLHDGRRDEALANVRALAGLANLHREEPVLAQQMSRVAVAGMGMELTWEALQSKGWTDEQLSALQKCWEGPDLLAAVQRGFEGEREVPLIAQGMAKDQIRAAMSGGTNGARATPNVRGAVSRYLYSSTILANDLRFALRYIQTQVDLTRQLNAGRPFPEVMKDMNNLYSKLQAKDRGPVKLFYLMSLVAIPNYTKAVEAAAAGETHRRLVVTAIALRRYEIKYGKPPQYLAALEPLFVRGVPRDCMDAQPLKYRVNGDGTWVLYSSGVDGQDNGGDATSMKPGSVRSFCEGRDAVWPAPAKRRESSETEQAPRAASL